MRIPGKIIAKPHPTTESSLIIDEAVYDVKTVPGHIPFEILLLSEDLKINRTLNISSSSTKEVNMEQNLLDTAGSYFDYYSDDNVIFVALDISKYLSKNNACKWLHAGHWDKTSRPVVDYMSGGSNLKDKGDCQDSTYIRIIEYARDHSYISGEFNDLDMKL